MPRYRSPEPVFEALSNALADHVVWTSGETPAGRLIDHIATSPDLTASGIEVWNGADSVPRLSLDPPMEASVPGAR